MPNLMIPSNAWWLSGGIALALPGLWLLVRALFADRARGRRRCPKCWYELGPGNSGNRPTCPECGHRVKRARQLRRTRRRWRRAAVVMLIIVAGAAVGARPFVSKQRALAMTPTAALIVALPWIDDAQGEVATTLLDRLRLRRWSVLDPWPAPEMDLSAWQRHLLVARCRAALHEQTPPAAHVLAMNILAGLGADAAPALEEVAAEMRIGDVTTLVAAARVMEQVGDDARPYLPDVVEALSTQPFNHGLVPLVRLLGRYRFDTKSSIDVLGRLAAEPFDGFGWITGVDEKPTIQGSALNALARIGRPARDALPRLATVARSRWGLRHRGGLRDRAIAAIEQIGATDRSACFAVIHALRTDDPGRRRSAADAVCSAPECVQLAVESFGLTIRDGSHPERLIAVRNLWTLGPDARAAVPTLTVLIDDDDQMLRMFAIHAIVLIGPDARAKERIRIAAEDPNPTVRRLARAALLAIEE